MNKLLYFLKENLDLTLREAKSTLVFLVVVCFALIFRIAQSFFYQANSIPLEVKSLALEKEFINSPSTDTNQKRKNLQKFNPNLATKEELVNLGLSEKTAQTILNYRSKGGKFRTKEDFKKIYAINESIYAELSPYIDIPTTANFSTTESKSTPYQQQKIQVFDINTADTAQLMALRGIGKTYANRIIKFRDALGGFYTMEQVSETYGISPEALVELKKYAKILSPVKKISINTVSDFKHPYLKNYQIKAILNYRTQHGDFKNWEDLANIKNIDQETLQKIAPYLSF